MSESVLSPRAGDHTLDDLWQVSKEGGMGMMMRLVVSKLDIAARDTDGSTALHYAAENGRMEIMSFLVMSGQFLIDDGDCLGKTALARALKAKQIEAAHYLVENGASLVAKDVVGKRPSDLANEENEELLAALKLKMNDPVKQMSPCSATVWPSKKSKHSKKTASRSKSPKPAKVTSSDRVAQGDAVKKEKAPREKTSHGTTRLKIGTMGRRRKASPRKVSSPFPGIELRTEKARPDGLTEASPFPGIVCYDTNPDSERALRLSSSASAEESSGHRKRSFSSEDGSPSSHLTLAARVEESSSPRGENKADVSKKRLSGARSASSPSSSGTLASAVAVRRKEKSGGSAIQSGEENKGALSSHRSAASSIHCPRPFRHLVTHLYELVSMLPAPLTGELESLLKSCTQDSSELKAHVLSDVEASNSPQLKEFLKHLKIIDAQLIMLEVVLEEGSINEVLEKVSAELIQLYSFFEHTSSDKSVVVDASTQLGNGNRSLLVRLLDRSETPISELLHASFLREMHLFRSLHDLSLPSSHDDAMLPVHVRAFNCVLHIHQNTVGMVQCASQPIGERKPVLAACAKDLLDCLHEVHVIAESLLSQKPLDVDPSEVDPVRLIQECSKRLKFASSALLTCQGSVVDALARSIATLANDMLVFSSDSVRSADTLLAICGRVATNGIHTGLLAASVVSHQKEHVSALLRQLVTNSMDLSLSLCLRLRLLALQGRCASMANSASLRLLVVSCMNCISYAIDVLVHAVISTQPKELPIGSLDELRSPR
eukprot:CAMPEP_0174240312 /NCGR_PEP_ID=MMETSP0417-20130205/18352_1 /TAXON_ID=242541 /ORGANISM="Mayorella sp, Strain BSH-02190019" /LENGTH=773 /DNA_ID=CAMNT_0015319377 /DNA_START=41 /DNA_END=2362 /DNA_ORIENTATION=-